MKKPGLVLVKKSACIGWLPVDVYIDMSSGASYVKVPPEGRNVMVIGGDVKSWSNVFDEFLHESFEIIASANDCHFTLTHRSTTNSDKMLVMTHVQFERICNEISPFMVKIQGDLFTIWNRERKKQKQSNHGK